MAIRDVFLPEFDHEMATTRKTLERVPENNIDWKPHDKSMTMGRLAGHLVELNTLVPLALQRESLDFRPPGAPPRNPTSCLTRKAPRRFRQERRRRPRRHRSIQRRRSEKIFTLQAGGKTIFSLPRTAVLRGFILNHIIHHRGQLSVYLRLNNVAVPSIYGPSADEQNSNHACHQKKTAGNFRCQPFQLQPNILPRLPVTAACGSRRLRRGPRRRHERCHHRHGSCSRHRHGSYFRRGIDCLPGLHHGTLRYHGIRHDPNYRPHIVPHHRP